MKSIYIMSEVKLVKRKTVAKFNISISDHDQKLPKPAIVLCKTCDTLRVQKGRGL